MDGEEAIYYLEYLRHDVHAKSLYDVALVKAIDALKQGSEPVKRGKWIDVDYKTLEHGFLETYPDEGVCCSECRTGFKKSRQLIRNFCPNCGARMDGDTNEEP